MALIAQGQLCEVHFTSLAEKYRRKHKISRLLFAEPSQISSNLSAWDLLLKEKPNCCSSWTK